MPVAPPRLHRILRQQRHVSEDHNERQNRGKKHPYGCESPQA